MEYHKNKTRKTIFHSKIVKNNKKLYKFEKKNEYLQGQEMGAIDTIKHNILFYTIICTTYTYV